MISPKLGWPAAGAALLVSFSRVYTGVHFPADVLVGMAVPLVVYRLVLLGRKKLDYS